jgi:hypothetical protein
VWTNGDSYQIWRVIESLDQAGVGGENGEGALLNATDPPTPVAYPNVDEPIHEWGNDPSGVSPGLSYIRPGEHFTNVAKVGFTPYTYPHPLVSSGGGAPPADQGPSVKTVLRGKAVVRGKVVLR